MPKLIEITPEQYDRLLELEMPAWYEHTPITDEAAAVAISSMQRGGSWLLPSVLIKRTAPETVTFYTLEESDG